MFPRRPDQAQNVVVLGDGDVVGGASLAEARADTVKLSADGRSVVRHGRLRKPAVSLAAPIGRVYLRSVEVERAEPVTVKCQECDAELAADSPSLHLELAYDDEWFAYCERCWEREFGDELS
jgi:hypothetical protein